jgi:hypothetical protein
MLYDAMTNPGSFRIPSRNRTYEAFLDPALRSARRTQRILDSLRSEIAGAAEAGVGGTVRIRRIFEHPREIFRLEIEAPSMAYQRTTLLDREALEELLEAEEVRARVRIHGS